MEPLVAHLLQDPLGDGGQWDMLCNLVNKYGVAPKDAMPETAVSSSTREEAIRKMQSALCELIIDGAGNNIEEQIEIVRDRRFRAGDYYTDLMKYFRPKKDRT